MPGGLEKMRIISFSDERFESEDAGGTFVVQVNPEGYSFKYKIEHDEQQAQGTSAVSPRFNKILPQELELEFLFDATGAIPEELNQAFAGAYSFDNGVVDAIDHFRSVVFEYQGDSHRPRHLKLVWGTLLFKGVLMEMEISFKLFRPDGTPLRAVAKTKLKGSVEDELRTAMENAQSTDITHLVQVRPGEGLPRLCHQVYGRPDFYLEVARANDLDRVRGLEAGMRLRFPPVAK
jgi:hypothetical protein